MRILVTRPDPDGARLGERLSAAGHKVIQAPLLHIVFEDGLSIDADAYQALLLTSANGVRALATMTEDRKARLFCVGDATARTAEAYGFSDIHIAGGDVHALTSLVRDRLRPTEKPLLHVAGSVVAGDLQGMLAEAGFRVERIVAYHAEPADHLPQDALNAIREQAIDLALFYSPRTARIFVALMDAADRQNERLSQSLATVTAGCLSQAVRDALQSLPWQRIVVSDVPSEAALLAASGLEPDTTPN
jgi:uroporphyrinogen-III synthase